MMALAGPAGCGKSLFQSIITETLGGRVAKAARYMQGGTDFNGDLFEAEHLALEDEFMSARISDRLQLGASIKNFCVSTRKQSCHRKNRQAVTLPAWWRVSITLNDDPEAMRVLPPLDDHIQACVIVAVALPCQRFATICLHGIARAWCSTFRFAKSRPYLILLKQLRRLILSKALHRRIQPRSNHQAVL